MSVWKQLVLKINNSMEYNIQYLDLEEENKIMFIALLFPPHLSDLLAFFSSKFTELL